MLFRLKNSPRRAKAAAMSGLTQWLDSISIDPASPCRGSSAVEVLFGRLYLEFGNTNIDAELNGMLKVGPTDTIAPSEARAYIWGVTEEIVTVPDEVEELEEETVVEDEEESASTEEDSDDEEEEAAAE